MIKDAILSLNRKYRYFLLRAWDLKKSPVMFIMLNPSTADEKMDDPTIRRCIGFAKSWGYGSLRVCNLYAYRTSSPKELKVVQRNENVIGTENITNILKYKCNDTIFAWGSHVLKYYGFDGSNSHINKIYTLFPEAKCLGKTKNGYPKHPLYLKGDLKPIPFFERVNAQTIRDC